MNHRRKFTEQVPEEDTVVWSCTKDGCKGWIRDTLSFDTEPKCRLCASPMIREVRMLPMLSNFIGEIKPLKRNDTEE